MSEKVYLAKSNRSNPDVVIRVRQILSKYNVEVIEFKGGAYSNKQLLTCDYLIIIPDLSEYEEDEHMVTFGRGLYDQLHDFKKANKSCWKTNSFIVYKTKDNYNEKEVFSSVYKDEDCADCDDYINHAYITLDEDNKENLEELLENRFGASKSDSKGKNKYMVLCAAK